MERFLPQPTCGGRPHDAGKGSQRASSDYTGLLHRLEAAHRNDDAKSYHSTVAPNQNDSNRRVPDLSRSELARLAGELRFPLTGLYSKECYADGHENDWSLAATDFRWTAVEVRDVYALRTNIEERHRHVKFFWDLMRFHSTAWNLMVSDTVFVSLTYSLLQLHMLVHAHEELNRRTHETTRRLLPHGDRMILPAAVSRVLHAAGGHGANVEFGGEGLPQSPGQDTPATARGPAVLPGEPRPCKSRWPRRRTPAAETAPLTSESQHVDSED
jgi:hypothetical protein